MTTTIDSAGRIVIPESLRHLAGLVPGSEIEISLRDGHLEIAPLAEMTIEQRGRFLVAVAPPGTPTMALGALEAFIVAQRERRAEAEQD